MFFQLPPGGTARAICRSSSERGAVTWFGIFTSSPLGGFSCTCIRSGFRVVSRDFFEGQSCKTAAVYDDVNLGKTLRMLSKSGLLKPHADATSASTTATCSSQGHV